MKRVCRIGTRGSRLALVQAELVRARLAAACPEVTFETVVITTRGDRETERAIAAIGDNALFTREIETALAAGRIDLAVHSMKDLPATCPEGLVLAKAWTREDPRDVLVARDGVRSLDDLPVGATVATGSPRRDLLLRRLRPDLRIVGIRGNVDTRLRRLFEPAPDEPRLDALVLAAAGLRRLGLTGVIRRHLPVEEMIPAANQGQLAIELRADDAELKAKVDALGDATADRVARAERAFLRELGSDCHQPIGAFAEARGDRIALRAVFARDVAAPPAFAAAEAEEPEEAARLAAREIFRRLAGVVTLVGAGPGDPDLVTVRGLRAIREADAVVSDRLAPEKLLDEVRPGCVRVYAGKASGRHALRQDEINALLAKLALAHAHVVRLKGGDPFVFGRGGEEVEYLTARGIPCAVVPGVSSALAAPASVGIPVTHRGVANSFAVVTAHAKGGEPAEIDYAGLSDARKTCVFLMGLAHVAEIASGLKAAGRAAATPAAVIASATTPAARCVVGTLDDIAARTAAAQIVSPAVLVVGETVALRGRLGFPLSGRRFLVPRIGPEPGRLEDLLRGLGAEVASVQVGRLEPVLGALDAVDWPRVTWLAFTSRNGLLPFDDALVDRVKARGIRLAAIGDSTAATLAKRGLAADFVSAEATGEGFVRAFREFLKPDDFVLHPTAEGMPDTLASLARVCGYAAAGVYRNVAVPLAKPPDLARFDAALFTCGSSVRRIYDRAVGTTRALAIGPTTRGVLEELGVRDIVMAPEPSPDALAGAVLTMVSEWM